MSLRLAAPILDLYDAVRLTVAEADAAAYTALFAADGALMPPEALPIRGTAAIQRWMVAFFAAWQPEIDEISFDAQGISVDVAFTRYTARGSYHSKTGGPDFAFDLKYVDTFVRDADGSWRFVTHMWSPNHPGPNVWLGYEAG
jgi:ketosteroid isomerase-like protein